MICPNCKKVVEDDAKFCSACGTVLSDDRKETPPIPPEPEKLKKCKVCGASIPESAICCPECGKFAGGISKPATAKSPSAKPAPTVNTKFCKACGKSIPKSAFYCPICNKIADTAPAPYAATESNGMALAGFILSFFVPLLGLIFGIIGLKRANNGADRRGLAIAAIVISIVSWVLNFILITSAMGELLSILTYL